MAASSKYSERSSDFEDSQVGWQSTMTHGVALRYTSQRYNMACPFDGVLYMLKIIFGRWVLHLLSIGHKRLTQMCSFTVAIQPIHSCLYDLKEYECGLRMDELSVKCLLYANDQVILAASACVL
ncbi:hypothetical protein EVAR_21637_1 [Eumeta japonica]|uniref:Reverse transcriptase domain-containing protein n=1 Tax=Eumeta variegata TaxID=151549 RepID=A0A4C1UY45_EUMVA|nr:hypothetical protein EVAR_21637_1 [Eumeta japonica]